MQIQQLAQSIVSLCNALGVSVNDVVAEMSASSSGAEAPELRHSAEVVEVPAVPLLRKECAEAEESYLTYIRQRDAERRLKYKAVENAALAGLKIYSAEREERAVNRALDAYQILMQIASSQRHMITIGRGHRLRDWDITVYRDGRAQALRIPFNGSFLDAMHHVRAKMQSEHMDDGIDWARSGKDEY